MNLISAKIGGLFTNAKSKKVAINVFQSAFVKLLNVAVSFALIPLSINYVTEEVYGVWLTIGSIITWITLFDFGLSNGLQNRVTEAHAQNKHGLIRTYISTSYAILIMIVLPFLALFAAVSSFIDWSGVLNARVGNDELTLVANMAVLGFTLQLALKPLTAFLMALHKHYLVGLTGFLANLLSLILIILVGRYATMSLLTLTIIISLSPVVVLLCFTLVLFGNQYKEMRPGLRFVDMEQKRTLFQLGGKFFIIQIAGLVMFSSNNILIAHLESAENVTVYNVVLRYFSVVTLVQSVIVGPLWPGYSEAYVQKDLAWIRRVIKKVNYLSLYLCVALAVMVVFSDFIYAKWINNSFSADLSLSVLMAVNIAVSLYAVNYTVFINGSGKILLQTFVSVVVCIVHIPVAYLLMKTFALGMNGLVALNIFWMLLSTILWSRQTTLVLRNVPSRIWNS